MYLFLFQLKINIKGFFMYIFSEQLKKYDTYL